MERLLADKTITLHDLANRGLLQLDQIRSYPTAPTSTDDDQRKAQEEALLDEFEASKKLADQHTLSKRLTDTSISAKHPSLAAAVRPSKSFVKDRQRKSSLSFEHQYRANEAPTSAATHRRRQTLTESTLSTASSRLLTQASMKKIFKCNSIFDLHSFIVALV